MRIESFGHAVPARRVTNEDLIERVVARARAAAAVTEREPIRSCFERQLLRTGARIRYHRTDGQDALSLGKAAIARALDAARLPPEAIDLLIYTGVGRGFVEPATANVFQAEMCLSTDQAQTLVRSRVARRVTELAYPRSSGPPIDQPARRSSGTGLGQPVPA